MSRDNFESYYIPRCGFARGYEYFERRYRANFRHKLIRNIDQQPTINLYNNYQSSSSSKIYYNYKNKHIQIDKYKYELKLNEAIRMNSYHKVEQFLKCYQDETEYLRKLLSDSLHIPIERKNYYNMFLLLIKYGSTVKDKYWFGYTMIKVVKNKCFKIAEYLINTGFDINIVDNKNRTPLYYAGSSIILVKLLVDHGAKINVKDESDISPILFMKNIDTIKYLLDHGADIDEQDKDGMTVLNMMCGDEKNINTVKLLIDRGANIYLPNNNGTTPLHSACISKKNSIIELLIMNGSNVNYVNKFDIIPLTYCAINGNISGVKTLIKNGANINYINRRGDSVIILAAKKRHIDVVKVLIRCRTNINIKNKSGKILMDYINEKDKDCIKKLIDNNRKKSLLFNVSTYVGGNKYLFDKKSLNELNRDIKLLI